MESLARIVSIAMEFLRLCVWLVLLTIVFVPLKEFARRPQKVFRKAWLQDFGW